jgi:transcriptional regulator with XRE-family HTH domain
MDDAVIEQLATGLQKRVAENVRQVRLAKSLTQEALAADAKLATRHLQKIEAGEVNVTLKTVAAIAGALGVCPESLLRPPEER